MQFDQAMTAPMFLRGCSQFCVEFAGDYVTQVDFSNTTTPTFHKPGGPPSANNLGAIKAFQSDGMLDFDVVYSLGSTGVTGTGLKKVRWYGMTRSVNGDADTDVPVVNFVPSQQVVHPVYWYIPTCANLTRVVWPAAAASPKYLPFEKIKSTGGAAAADNSYPQTASRNRAIDTYTTAWSPYNLKWHSEDPNYTAVWAANGTTMGKAFPSGFMPWMIRITLRIDDPNGRLQEGQTVEWIYNLPHVTAAQAAPD